MNDVSDLTVRGRARLARRSCSAVDLGHIYSQHNHQPQTKPPHLSWENQRLHDLIHPVNLSQPAPMCREQQWTKFLEMAADLNPTLLLRCETSYSSWCVLST
ncbi:hypothetical protein AOLI_G00040310 [Acnodon oligacanthus]